MGKLMIKFRKHLFCFFSHLFKQEALAEVNDPNRRKKKNLFFFLSWILLHFRFAISADKEIPRLSAIFRETSWVSYKRKNFSLMSNSIFTEVRII